MGRVDRIYEEMKKKKSGEGRAATTTPVIKPAVQTIVDNAKKPLPMPGQRTQQAAQKPSLATLSPQQMRDYNLSKRVPVMVAAPKATMPQIPSVSTPKAQGPAEFHAAPEENAFSRMMDAISESDFVQNLKRNLGIQSAEEYVRATAWKPQDIISSVVAKEANPNQEHTLGNPEIARDIVSETNIVPRENRNDILKSIENAEKSYEYSPWEAAGANALAALSEIGRNEANFLKIFGADKIPGVRDFIQEVNKAADVAQRNAAVYNKSANDSFRSQLTQGITYLLPYAALQLMQGGKDIIGTGAVKATKTTLDIVKDVMKNPTFWFSVTNGAGQKYEEAISNGADRATATVNAMYAIPEALVELGGGFGADDMLENSVSKSTLWETGEELAQKLINNFGVKNTYKPEMPWVSMDEEAVINPKEYAEEAAMAGLVSSIGIGGTKAISKGINAVGNIPSKFVKTDDFSQDGSAEFSDTKKARKAISASLEGIRNFVGRALKNENANKYIKVSDVDARLKKMLNDNGVTEEVRMHAISDNGIRHNDKSHGAQSNDKYKVEAKDYERVTEITKDYDELFIGYPTQNGNTTVVYKKVYDNVVYYVEEIIDDGVMSTKQMIKVGLRSKPSFLKKIKKIDSRTPTTDVTSISSFNRVQGTPPGEHVQDEVSSAVKDIVSQPTSTVNTGDAVLDNVIGELEPGKNIKARQVTAITKSRSAMRKLGQISGERITTITDELDQRKAITRALEQVRDRNATASEQIVDDDVAGVARSGVTPHPSADADSFPSRGSHGESGAKTVKPIVDTQGRALGLDGAPYAREGAGLVRDANYRRANIPARKARVLDAIAKVTGTKIVFVPEINGGRDNARYKDGVIEIALDCKNPVGVAFTHELVHRIRDVDPETYAELKRYVYENMDEQSLRDIEEGKKRTYADKSTEDIQEEVVADAFGYILGDSVRLEQFVRDNRKTAEKIADWMRDLIIRIKKWSIREGLMTREELYAGNGTKYDASGKKAFAELTADLDAMAQALSNAIEATAQAVQDGTEQHATVGAKSLIKRTENNVPFVEITEDILDGVPQKDWVKTVRENLSKKFPQGITVARNQIKVNSVTKGEMTNSEYSRWIRDNEPTKYSDKLKATNNADEIVQATTNWIGEGPNHPRKDNIKEFARGAVLMRVGENDYIGDVVVATTKGNHMELYDIVNIMPTTIKEKNLSQTAAISNNGASHRTSTTSSKQTVPQTDTGVNTQYMQSDGENSKYSSKADNDMYKALIEEYGEMKPGEKPARVVQVPKKTGANAKVRRGARTIMEAGSVPDEFASEMEQEIVNGTFSYEPQADKRTLERVNADIEYNGWKESMARWNAVVNGTERASKENIVLGEMLLVNAANAGDTELAMKLAAELAAEATRAGQEIQAIRLLKKMSPERRLYTAERKVRSLQKDLEEVHGDDAPKLRIPKAIADALLNAQTDEEQEAVDVALWGTIAAQVPPTFQDKWNAWRYLAMLGNARTHGRNIVGNALFSVLLRMPKNIIKSVIELTPLKALEGKRTATVATLAPTKKNREIWGFVKEDMKNQGNTMFGTYKYNPENIIANERKIFNNKLLEGIRRFNSKALEAEDGWFKKLTYMDSMAQAIKANNCSLEFLRSGTKEANQALEYCRQYAISEALKATFNDASVVAEKLSNAMRMKDGDSKTMKVAKAMGEGVLPFKKTPINIVKRGVEYSPVGLAKAVFLDIPFKVTKGKMTAAQCIDEIASGLTGTGIMILGFWMASIGMLKGKMEDDKEDDFEELQGEQGYSLVIGDKSYTIDWMAPTSLPLFCGVELWKVVKTWSSGEKNFIKKVLDALEKITEPVIEMSMMQGLQDAITSVKFSESALPEMAVDALTNYATQAIPTLSGQIARTVDGTRRTTYYSKDGALPKAVGQLNNKVLSKIPGLSTVLEPYVDEWGREGDNGRVVERILENFVSPGYYSKKTSDTVEREIARLYAETSEGSVLPKRAESSFSYKEKTYYKTSEELTKYQKTFGGTSYKLRKAAYADSNYKRLTDEEKVAVAEKIAEVANSRAKIEFFKGRDVEYEPDSFMEKLDEARKAGIGEHVVILAWVLQKDVESIKDKDGDPVNYSSSLRKRSAIDKARPSLSLERRRVLYEVFGVGKDVIKMSDASVKTRLESMEKKYAKYNKKKKGA